MPAVAKGVAGATKPAQALIMGWLKRGIVAGDMRFENGWVFTTKTGLQGTNYLQRALITAIGLGADRPEDAVYPTSEGTNIKGFWSLTMYDRGQRARSVHAQSATS